MIKMTENNGMITYKEHNDIMRQSERQADERFQAERDRRYAEVNTEREKALKIKETADLAALELARESQKYKEERNDAVREQSIAASGIYATHADVASVADKMGKAISEVAERMESALEPLATFVAAQKGSTKATDKTIAYVVTGISVLLGLAGFIFGIIQVIAK